MNKKDASRLRDIAHSLGLNFDERAQAIYGNYRGFQMVLVQGAQRGIYTILTSASISGQPIDRKACQPYAKASKAIAGIAANRFLLTISIKPASFSANKVFTRIPEAFTDAAKMLEEMGATCCCQDTGAYTDLGVYMCGAMPAILSAEAYAARSRLAVQSEQSEFLKNENFAAGIVGALLGSLIGVLAIVIIGQMGYVAAISGFIMAICTLKGYEKLAGKLSKKGIIASVVIMILMVYVGNRLNWAIAVAKAFDVDIMTAFKSIEYLMEYEAIEPARFYGNMVLIFLFVALGAFSTIKNGLAAASGVSRGVYPLGTQPVLASREEYTDSPVDRDMM